MAHHAIDVIAGGWTAGEASWIGGLEVEASGCEATTTTRTEDVFGRLVRLVRDNERLQAELDATRARVRDAFDYLAAPNANPALALALLERLRLRRSALLAHLRANRVEARELLGHQAAGAGTDLGDDSLN